MMEVHELHVLIIDQDCTFVVHERRISGKRLVTAPIELEEDQERQSSLLKLFCMVSQCHYFITGWSTLYKSDHVVFLNVRYVIL